MDTKKLEALLTAVELGSFTRAAEVLGYTQSGLTHMMNSLEKDLGFTVLVRGRSGVRLTPSGQRILPMVRDCLASVSALEREITLINTHKEDSVRVAAYESIARHWLPEIIQQFRREHPDVTVDIQMGSVDQVYRWVAEARVDMCFASRQEPLRWSGRRSGTTSFLPSCRRTTTAGRRYSRWRASATRSSSCPPWASTRTSSASSTRTASRR